MTPILRLATAAAVAFALAVPSVAHAQCRTTTVKVPVDYDGGPGDCWAQGLPLWWKNSCIGYDVQQDASNQISLADATSLMRMAYDAWTTNIKCQTTSGGFAPPSIVVEDLGPVVCATPGWNSRAPNQNVIIFEDHEWPYKDRDNALGITIVNFDAKTGQIRDGDMVFNTTASVVFATSDPVGSNQTDAFSVFAHEAGHLLGMGHTQVKGDVMYPNYAKGTIYQRQPSLDEAAGMCAIYRPDGTRAVSTLVSPNGLVDAGPCDPTPINGFTSVCAVNPPRRRGCHCNTQSEATPSSALATALGLALALFVRRRAKG